MLVGVGGSGKQSLARLAGHICGYATCTITISGSYTINNFKEDIQKMYKRAGIKVWAYLLPTCRVGIDVVFHCEVAACLH